MNSRRSSYGSGINYVPDVQVSCPRKERGCLWKGDFRHIPNHENECPYGDSVLLQEVCRRMDTWEDVMQAKEKDIQILKYNLNEMREVLSEKQQEIDVLKTDKCNIEGELKVIKEKNKELQQRLEQKIENLAYTRKKDASYQKHNIHEIKENLNQKQEEINELRRENSKIKEEVKMINEKNQEAANQLELKTENVVLKNELMEKKCDETETKMVTFKKQLQQDVVMVKSEVKNIRDTVKNAVAQLNKQFEELQATIKDEVKAMGKDVNNLRTEMADTRCYFGNSLKEKTEKINKISAQFTNTEDNYIKLSKKVKKEIEDRDATMKNMRTGADVVTKTVSQLKHHISNIENILFCDYSDGTGVILQWKLQNYQYHQKRAERVCSPIFFTQLQGYRFKLFLEWSGVEKDKLDLCLMLCSGNNNDKPLERFKMAYTLEMQDNKGNIMSYAIPLRQIETYTGKCFTIQPGQNEAEYGFGCAPFLTMPELANYIVNDMLSINCRITPL